MTSSALTESAEHAAEEVTPTTNLRNAEQELAKASKLSAPKSTPQSTIQSTTPSTTPSPQPHKPKRTPAKDLRIANQPAFVLHSYPYKETSLIIDVLSRDHGRVALVAKGAKRPHSKLRSVLQTFQPLTLAWSGKSDIRTLVGAEWVGGMLPLERSALLFGFYLNELLVKFLVRDEPHPALFDHYVSTLNQLAHNESPTIVLRQFELALLTESGLMGDLLYCTATRSAVISDVVYVFEPERGARRAMPSDTAPRVLGQTLIDMHAANYQNPTTQSQSKMLMRSLLAHHLHGAPLNTRQILIDLQKL